MASFDNEEQEIIKKQVKAYTPSQEYQDFYGRRTLRIHSSLGPCCILGFLPCYCNTTRMASPHDAA